MLYLLYVITCHVMIKYPHVYVQRSISHTFKIILSQPQATMVDYRSGTLFFILE